MKRNLNIYPLLNKGFEFIKLDLFYIPIVIIGMVVSLIMTNDVLVLLFLWIVFSPCIVATFNLIDNKEKSKNNFFYFIKLYKKFVVNSVGITLVYSLFMYMIYIFIEITKKLNIRYANVLMIYLVYLLIAYTVTLALISRYRYSFSSYLRLGIILTFKNIKTGSMIFLSEIVAVQLMTLLSPISIFFLVSPFMGIQFWACKSIFRYVDRIYIK